MVEIEEAQCEQVYGLRDAKEGRQAFLERRKPNFEDS
jgi:1,4-dihydroxy-2-naphthoyl-CoA synthase